MAPELQAFPSDFGDTDNIERQQAWDIEIEWHGHLPGLIHEIERQRATLPLAAPGYEWYVDSSAHEYIYDMTLGTMRIHWSQRKETA